MIAQCNGLCYVRREETFVLSSDNAKITKKIDHEVNTCMHFAFVLIRIGKLNLSLHK